MKYHALLVMVNLFWGWGIELRALSMLGKCSTPWILPPSLLFCILFSRQGLWQFLRLALSLKSSCLILQSSGDYRHQAEIINLDCQLDWNEITEG
jgi:hypothetical protein